MSIVLSRDFNKEIENRGRMRPSHKHDLSGSFIVDSDNVSLITKLRLGPKVMLLRFDRNSFFNTILGLTAYWDYKDFGNEYFSEKKNRNLSTINKIHLKCDCIDSIELNGVRQPILYSLVSNKPPGYKVLASLKQFIIRKKINLF